MTEHLDVVEDVTSHCVLVVLCRPKEKIGNSMLYAPEKMRRAEECGTHFAKILKISESAYCDTPYNPNYQPGDYIVFSNYAGVPIITRSNGFPEEQRLVLDREILGRANIEFIKEHYEV